MTWAVRHRYAVLVAVGVLLYVVPLGLRDLWYPGEPDMAEVARAMFVSGDWIVPRRNGVPWLNYGPVMYWSACLASLPIGELTPFTLRLPSALASLALVLGTCAAASRWFGPRAGLWSGLALATFVQFTYEAINYRPDPQFAAAIGLGLLAYARGAESAAWWPRVAGFACFGIAILVKGPLGLLLPGMILTLWHGARREWRMLLALAPLALAALVVAAPWYAAGVRAMGADEFWGQIHGQNLRFGSASMGHRRPWHMYLGTVWADLALWSLLLPFALAWIARTDARRDRNVQLALLWFFASFAFFSLASTKRQVYLLPAYPGAALLLGRWLAAVVDGEAPARAARWVGLGLAAVFAAIGVAGLAAFAGADAIAERMEMDELGLEVMALLRPRFAVLGVVSLAASVWTARGWIGGDARRGLARLAASAVALLFVITSVALPALEPAKTFRPGGTWIRERLDGEPLVGYLNPHSGGLNKGAIGFHAHALVQLLEPGEVGAFLREHPRSVVVVHNRSFADLEASDGIDWAPRVEKEFYGGGDLYLVVGRQ